MKSGRAIYWIAAALFAVAVFGQDAAGEWLDPGWTYRLPVDLDNPCGEEATDLPVRVLLDESFDFSKALEDGADLRITAADGESPLPFWIEKWDEADQVASVWARIPSLATGGGRIYLYYGNASAESTGEGKAAFEVYDGFEGFEVGQAPVSVPHNPGQWTRYEGNPVLVEGASGEWDDHGATFASVIVDQTAGEFRMYYHGWAFSGPHQIGLATSPDGLNWTKYAGNPVVRPGPEAWDASSVRVPMVWKEGPADYRMMYTGVGPDGLQIGHARSTDGIVWTKHTEPVFNDPGWARGQNENWGVIKVDGQYLMWYSTFGMRQIGIAVSEDLIHWEPHQDTPVFASSGDPDDPRYSQFCPFTFKRGDFFYVLVPSYSSIGNYCRFYMYRSSSPFFPEEDRHLVRVAHAIGETGWDDTDNDTPCVLTLDIERSVFYNDQLWTYYSAEGGAYLFKEGLLIEPDIDAALTDAPPPEDAFSWTANGDVTVTDGPVFNGSRAVWQHDASGSATTQLIGSFDPMESGATGAWMRRSGATYGNYNLYLYGGASLAAVAGIGRDGDFDYWDGSFQNTGVPWSPDIWYFVDLAFDAAAGTYDFSVHDTGLSEIVRVEGIAFGNPADSIDRAMAYTSSAFLEEGHLDDFRVRNWCGADPHAEPGEEEAYEPVTCHLDADGDGYGDPETAREFSGACEPGWVLDSTDCDDSRPDVNPGVPERCNDGIDNDCDGEIDEDCWSLCSAAAPGSTPPTLGNVVLSLLPFLAALAGLLWAKARRRHIIG